MKRVLFLLLSVFLLAGCTESTVTPEDLTDAADNTEIVYDPNADEPGEVGEDIKEPIDWTQAAREAIDLFTEDFTDVLYADGFDMVVDEEAKTITLQIQVADNTKPDAALEYANTVLRRLNDEVLTDQDNELTPSTDAFYGGIYDEFSVSLGVSTAAQKDSADSWFINTSIPAGQHLPLELQAAYQ